MSKYTNPWANAMADRGWNWVGGIGPWMKFRRGELIAKEGDALWKKDSKEVDALMAEQARRS